MDTKGKIKSFTDLFAWKKAHNFVLDIYKTTKKFPQEERFSLIDQMRRAAISITSNIAEGFSKRTSQDKTHFYYHALASLTEIQNQLIIARDLSYITNIQFQQLAQQSIEVHKLIHGIIKSSITK